MALIPEWKDMADESTPQTPKGWLITTAWRPSSTHPTDTARHRLEMSCPDEAAAGNRPASVGDSLQLYFLLRCTRASPCVGR